MFAAEGVTAKSDQCFWCRMLPSLDWQHTWLIMAGDASGLLLITHKPPEPFMSYPHCPWLLGSLQAHHLIHVLTGSAENKQRSHRLSLAAYPGPSWVRSVFPGLSSSASLNSRRGKRREAGGSDRSNGHATACSQHGCTAALLLPPAQPALPLHGDTPAVFEMDLQSRRTALCSAAFCSSRKARCPHPRSSTSQHSTQQWALWWGHSLPYSWETLPPSRATCAPQQHWFSPGIWKKLKFVRA